jgi:hypothetical protein
MAENPSPHYLVDRVGKVVGQVRDLLHRSSALGIRADVELAWTGLLKQLRENPGGWGDPLWSTKLAGGTVHRGIFIPLVVRFVIYEPQRIVWILDVQPLPGHALAQS